MVLDPPCSICHRRGAPAGWLAVLFMLILLAAAPASGLTVALADAQTASGLRWLDVAGQPYSAAFQASYTYGDGGVAVQIAFAPRSEVFAGTLTAVGLKPNFAYQIKIEGTPGGRLDNEWVGLAGRWWEERWLGNAWGAGTNLNIQPVLDPAYDYPNLNLNDLIYASRRDLIDGTGHLLYRYTGYLVLGYFVTDALGTACVPFRADNSYHVLWTTQQRARDALHDGPVVEASLDAASSYLPFAYEAPGATAAVAVFGEWERLPRDGVALPPGDYQVRFLLAEESFHSPYALGGAWAKAMQADIAFTCLASGQTDTTASWVVSFSAGDNGDLLGRREQVVPAGGMTTPVTAVAAPGFVFDAWSDGETANPRALFDVQSNVALTARFRPAAAVFRDGAYLASVDAAAGHGLWDLTGHYEASVCGYPLCLDLVLDRRGRLRGHGSLTVASALIPLAVTGRLAGATGELAMTLRAAGRDRLLWSGLPAAADVRLDLGLDQAARTLSGAATLDLLAGAEATHRTGVCTLAVPPPMDGSFALWLNLAFDGAAIDGTAELRLANGTAYPLAVRRGRCEAGAVRLSLAGDRRDPAVAGLRIMTRVVLLEDGTARIEAFATRVFGQSLAW